MAEDDENEIISKIYDLVTTPDQYDAFMLSLQDKLDVLSKRGSQQTIDSHLSRASALVDIVTPWRREADSELHTLLSLKMQAMLAVDRAGQIRDSSSAAAVTYDLVPGAGLDSLPLDSDQSESLLRHVRAVIDRRQLRNSPNDVLRYRNTVTGRPMLVTLEPYFNATSNETLAILKTNDFGWPSHLGPILQDLFDLTRAEVEVIRLMVEGDKVAEIARRRCSTTTTVRSQLRSIFAKTDTGSQMECVQMVLGLAMMHDADQGNLVAARIQAVQSTAFYPRDDQRKIFELPNGRQIDYSVFGAQKGQTVLFMHDQAFGDVWFKDSVDAAVKAGLRILAPLRPGFGHTTLYPGKTSEPADFAPELVQLLDHLEVTRAPIISVSSGLVHSLALAKLIPDRILGISAAHPLLPVTEDADLEGTNGYNYLIPHTRLHFPQAVRFLCKAGFAFVTSAGPGAFGKAVMRASAKDVEWISRPDILPVMEQGRRVHQIQGYVGNYGDIAYREDWRPLLINAPVAVRLVIGEHDRNVQWNAARKWSADLDHVSLHVMPNSGYMVQHQHNGQFLKWVKQDIAAAAQ